MINGWRICNGSALQDLRVETNADDKGVPQSVDLSHVDFAETLTLDVEAIPALQEVLTTIMRRVNEAKAS